MTDQLPAKVLLHYWNNHMTDESATALLKTAVACADGARATIHLTRAKQLLEYIQELQKERDEYFKSYTQSFRDYQPL